MTPEEIRALYLKTLARAELASVSFLHPYDGVQSTAVRTNDDAAQAAVDALAAAGLLPTGIEWGAGEVEDHTTDLVRTVPHDVHEDEKDARADALVNGEPLMQRFSHDWREVAE